MAIYVTMYQAEDGTLHETMQDAEQHESEAHIERMIRATEVWDTDDGITPAMAHWIAEHLGVLASIQRYPSIAKRTVDRYLGISEEPETPAVAEENAA